jgi:CRISPR-associated protein Cmr6
MTSRRTVLANTPLPHNNQYPHAGLWLDKFLTGQDGGSEDTKPATQLVKEVSGVAEPAGYKLFYDRWLDTLAQLGVKPRPIKINGRLAIGLGRASVVETGITLHHTYGVPVIPGSGLKGLASTYADQYLANTLWQKGEKAHNALFGTTKAAGVVTFFDALPLPGQWQLRPDVITVHHPSYYRGENKPPADWDSPTPIPFLTVTGTFLVALQPSPGAEGWEEVAYGILGHAAAELGVGAKTSSGYGRMELNGKAAESPETEGVYRFEQELTDLPNNRVAQEIGGFVNRWRAAEVAEPYKQQMAQAILDKVEAAGRTRKSLEKAWYQELVRYVASDTK